MKSLKFFTFLVLLFSSKTFAQQWDHGSLSLIGNYNGDYFLRVTNVPNESNAVPSYNERLFKLSKSLGKDGFAIALAAISSKKQVFISSDVDTPTGAYPVISIIYLTNKPVIE
ncbi:MAG: hypothetical protein CMK65_01000 [Pseudoalteromonas sp.]|uniref:hypothetical protein n=1 Tax=Pseudoalteromonas sp. TaxID=53249 RepID=UPI000C895332|nr:hypothetical protein [Pseudoalteromonas sp.]MAD02191.1 hypothetical protein [Pseudoalteromonas sp.]|tara:strand:+ start:172 stop:510 length:339 start_codon:yes stop_codon:yes gene_type:complete